MRVDVHPQSQRAIRSLERWSEIRTNIRDGRRRVAMNSRTRDPAPFTEAWHGTCVVGLKTSSDSRPPWYITYDHYDNCMSRQTTASQLERSGHCFLVAGYLVGDSSSR